MRLQSGIISKQKSIMCTSCSSHDIFTAHKIFFYSNQHTCRNTCISVPFSWEYWAHFWSHVEQISVSLSTSRKQLLFTPIQEWTSSLLPSQYLSIYSFPFYYFLSPFWIVSCLKSLWIVRWINGIRVFLK